MGELEQLKKRIDDSGFVGVENAHIRDDYEPVGGVMLQTLTCSGGYVQRKVPPHSFTQKWRIFKKGYEPY